MRITVDDLTTLELLNADHAKYIFALANSDKAYLREFLPWIDQGTSVEFFDNFTTRSLEQYAAKTEYPFAIIYEDKFVGRIGLNKINLNNRIAEIGYWMAEDVQGKGIMTKSCRAIIEYAFDTLDLNRIEIKCAVSNLKSQLIPERLGFSKEGTLRQAELIRGEFHDLFLYSLCKNDFIEYRLL